MKAMKIGVFVVDTDLDCFFHINIVALAASNLFRMVKLSAANYVASV